MNLRRAADNLLPEEDLAIFELPLSHCIGRLQSGGLVADVNFAGFENLARPVDEVAMEAMRRVDVVFAK